MPCRIHWRLSALAGKEGVETTLGPPPAAGAGGVPRPGASTAGRRRCDALLALSEGVRAPFDDLEGGAGQEPVGVADSGLVLSDRYQVCVRAPGLRPEGVGYQQARLLPARLRCVC